MKEAYFDRFYVDKEHFDKYKDIENDEKFIFKNHPELFLLCACIGYKYSLRKKLDKKEQLVLKNPILNTEYGNIIYQMFKIIAEKNNEINQNNEVIVNTIMEEYAKGGFDYLMDTILSNEKPVDNLTKFKDFILFNINKNL